VWPQFLQTAGGEAIGILPLKEKARIYEIELKGGAALRCNLLQLPLEFCPRIARFHQHCHGMEMLGERGMTNIVSKELVQFALLLPGLVPWHPTLELFANTRSEAINANPRLLSSAGLRNRHRGTSVCWRAHGLVDGSGTEMSQRADSPQSLNLLAPNATLALAACIPVIIMTSLYFGIVVASLQLPNQMRAFVSAIFQWIIALVGLGPTTVALLTDRLFTDLKALTPMLAAEAPAGCTREALAAPTSAVGPAAC